MNARLSAIRARRETAVDLYAAPESRRDARLLLERDDVPAMVAALEAVLARHVEFRPALSCRNCHYEWPCPTVRAINLALLPAQGTTR